MSSKIKYLILVLLFILFYINPPKITASILINEISPSTDIEWVELYNDGDVDINLSGFLLEDGNSSHTDDLILNGTITPKGFIVFNHAEGWLNNGGDSLKLYNNASPSVVIDIYTYGSVDSTKSIARIPNGSENWQVMSNITNNYSNPNPTPTQQATNAPTTSPTKSPTPNPTASPSLKPTVTKTPTSKPSPSNGPESTDTPDNLVSEIKISDATPIGLVAGDKTTNKSPLIALILTIFGVGFLGYGGYLLYNNNRINHDKINETS